MANITLGTRFGRWVVNGPREVVLYEKRNKRGRRYRSYYYPCVCDCGTERMVSESGLLSNSTSCGCYNQERPIKHGFRYHPLYRKWRAMKDRCCNHKHKYYNDYGGRGITICSEWLNDPAAFVRWGLSHGWAEGLIIDRKDNDAGYNPENCRFVDNDVSFNNKRTTRLISAFGESKSIAQWAKDSRSVVNRQTLGSRITVGWDAELAITTPPT